jgi:D-alanyl-D-alanine carboxypeptidase/D-alanyl-D-alanine-endopeptidase (penicillin-binding protein 4)
MGQFSGRPRGLRIIAAVLRPALNLTRLLLSLLVTVSSTCLSAPALRADGLPESIRTALTRARIDSQQLALWVAPAEGGPPRLSHQPDRLVNPASLMKLVTSTAALEQLGPAFSWTTSIYLDGKLRPDGVLDGSLIVQGRGDPKLVPEQVDRLLKQIRDRGVQRIHGDVVLDSSAFRIPIVDPGAFDGERFRPYNVRPDALMLNWKAVTLMLRPEPEQRRARVWIEPPLAGVQVPASVPLTAVGGAGEPGCGDWREALKADLSDPTRIRLTGSFAARCGEKSWPIAYADPAGYNARAFEAAWKALGGQIDGRVRTSATPAVPEGRAPWLEFSSPALADVLRDMNKFSNNVMAHQVFLTLGLTPGAGASASAPASEPGSWEAARQIVMNVMRQRAGCGDGQLVLRGGSGLSREERLTARCLGQVLQWGWTSPWMPELLSSLPLSGVEATARRTGAGTLSGRAHLKTGSLNEVSAIAGYLHGSSGRRWAIVAILNGAQVHGDEARSVLEAVLRWTADLPEPATAP